MPYFEYDQNNSGGSFHVDHKRGISVSVIVEADNAQEADLRAEKIGLYFDGCDRGRDCSCCGDRWYANSWTDEKGDLVPSRCGKPIVIGGRKDKYDNWVNDGPEGYVHNKNGTIQAFGLPNPDKVRPTVLLEIQNSGSKIYAKCADCNKKVQINKKGLGSLHICE